MTSLELDPFAGLLAGQYEIEREIGRGGMGVVYLARDVKLDRPVAIKTLPPALASDATIRERFLREARTAARLSHPNIVPIYRADEVGGQVFFAMGYIEGQSLADRVRDEHRLDPRDVLRVMRDVASALGYAAAHGVVHRDVKAENILLNARTGSAVVTDFGIARLAEAKPLTATGQVLGTVYYMSPEQVGGSGVDGRSDLYSLGVVGFFALAGRFPFDAPLASAVLVAQVMTPAPPVLTVLPGAPRPLAEIIDRCLAKDPGVRYQSGEELADALRRVEGEVARDAARATLAPAAPALVSDAEAREIWQRAAELQAMTGVQPRGVPAVHARDAASDAQRTSGFALGQVRSAAEDAGIPAQYVDHALAERGLAHPAAGAAARAVHVRDLKPRAPWYAGGPTQIEFEVVVPGEVPEREFDYLTDIIRRHLSEAGAISGTNRSLTWSSLTKQRPLHVTVSTRSGKTTIRAVESLGGLAGSLFGGIVGGAGGGMTGALVPLSLTVFHSAAMIIPVEAAWVLSMYALARGIFGARGRKRKATLKALVDELVQQVQESVGGTPAAALPPGRPPESVE